MRKLIWLSDLHYVAEGLVQDHDPRDRLARAIDYTNTHHGDAAVCVISGDMVDRATPEDYAALAAQLSGLSMPYLPMVGNHDDRDLLRTHLPLPTNTMSDFVQYAVQVGDDLILCLDTLTPGEDRGSFCEARMAWLRDQLITHSGARISVFMHHPPMPLGLPMQDADRLAEGEAVLQMLQGHAGIGHLFLGHVHRPVSGAMDGMPYAALRSVLYQAPAPWPAWDWDSFAPAKEAPALGVVSFETGGIRVHMAQFCDYADGVI